VAHDVLSSDSKGLCLKKNILHASLCLIQVKDKHKKNKKINHEIILLYDNIVQDITLRRRWVTFRKQEDF